MHHFQVNSFVYLLIMPQNQLIAFNLKLQNDINFENSISSLYPSWLRFLASSIISEKLIVSTDFRRRNASTPNVLSEYSLGDKKL
jgi:hypothetical protein